MTGAHLDVHRAGGGATRMLLIHGSGSAAKPMLGLGRQLVERLPDSEVMAVGLAGYGSEPADPQLPVLEQHLGVLLDGMGDRQWHLIGHSMGGYLALQLARQAPSQVLTLSLIEPMAFGVLDPEEDREAIELDQRVMRQFTRTDPAAGIAHFIEAWNQTRWDSLPEGLRRQLTRLAPLICEEANAVSSDRTTLSDYAGLTQPMLLLAGTESPLPAQKIVQRFAELPFAAPVHWLEGAGHMSVLRDPEIYAAPIAAHIQAASRAS